MNPNNRMENARTENSQFDFIIAFVSIARQANLILLF